MQIERRALLAALERERSLARAASSEAERERALDSAARLVRACEGNCASPQIVEILLSMGKIASNSLGLWRSIGDLLAAALGIAEQLEPGGLLEGDVRAAMGYFALRRGAADGALAEFERARDIAAHCGALEVTLMRRSSVCAALRVLGRSNEEAREARTLISEAQRGAGDYTTAIIVGHMHLASALERSGAYVEAYEVCQKLAALLEDRHTPQARRELLGVQETMHRLLSLIQGAG
jgi:hypothetical protein